MDERNAIPTSPTDRELLDVALAQLVEDARTYDEAVESYNVHLANHRERRDLHDLPLREPITAHEALESALDGDREALASVLSTVLDETHLDSAVRRHPRVYPIHLEAVEHLEIARRQLVTTLEEALRHLVLVAENSSEQSRSNGDS